MESTLFLYFLFHLLSEAFYYENNLSFDIVLIAKPKLRRDYIFMIHQEQLRFNKKIKFNIVLIISTVPTERWLTLYTKTTVATHVIANMIAVTTI